MKTQAGQEQGSAVCEEAGVDDGWACVPLMRELFQCPSQEWLGLVQGA